MNEMTIVGNIKNVLFDVLKSYSIRKVLGQDTDRVFIQPAVVSWHTSAPNSKRKYATVTVKLGFVPDAFSNGLKTVESLNPSEVGMILYTSTGESNLSDEAKELVVGADNYLDEVFEHYPQLGELFNKFLVDWESEYAKAVGKEDAEDAMDSKDSEGRSE